VRLRRIEEDFLGFSIPPSSLQGPAPPRLLFSGCCFFFATVEWEAVTPPALSPPAHVFQTAANPPPSHLTVLFFPPPGTNMMFFSRAGLNSAAAAALETQAGKTHQKEQAAPLSGIAIPPFSSVPATFLLFLRRLLSPGESASLKPFQTKQLSDEGFWNRTKFLSSAIGSPSLSLRMSGSNFFFVYLSNKTWRPRCMQPVRNS